MSNEEVREGQDTATGTDRDAKYEEPGFEDKSLGQAVDQDMNTVDALVAESGGELDAADEKFEEESAGSPALARQDGDLSEVSTGSAERTGESQAEENRANDPPA